MSRERRLLVSPIPTGWSLAQRHRGAAPMAVHPGQAEVNRFFPLMVGVDAYSVP